MAISSKFGNSKKWFNYNEIARKRQYQYRQTDSFCLNERGLQLILAAPLTSSLASSEVRCEVVIYILLANQIANFET